MPDTALLRASHAAGKPYDAYLASDPTKAANWRRIEAQVAVTPAQRELIGGFVRRMPVLAISGIWCGDCVQQGPLLHHIAETSKLIDLRWVDRDEHAHLAEQLRICGGLRVPTIVFMNEDHEFAGLAGDRTLSRYRAIAARQLGPSCPLPGAPVPAEELAATLQDWVNEFERVHLMLRLSPKLRERHGD